MKCKGLVHRQRCDRPGRRTGLYSSTRDKQSRREKQKTPRRQHNKCRAQKFQTKVAKRWVPQKGFERSRDLQPVLHNKQTQLLHFQQCFLTSCQYDSSWIVPAIPEAMLTAVFKANSATGCWRCPHLRATGKRRPSVKHKMKMHYHFEHIMGEQPWEKRKFSDRKS